MKDIIDLIEGIVIVIIGTCTLFLWKKFAIEVQKFSFVKYGKPQEIGLRIGFYVIGFSFILGGIYLIYKYFCK